MVSALDSRVRCPADTRMAAAKHALRYQKGSKRYKLILRHGNNDQLWALVDANWRRNSDTDRQSRSVVIIEYGNAPIFITRCIRKSVSLNATEAEHRLLSDAARNIVWFRNLPNKLEIEQTCMPNYHDNVGLLECVKWRTAKHLLRRKHVDTRHNFVSDMAETENIDLVKTPTANMVANYLTKTLTPRISKLRSRGQGDSVKINFLSRDFVCWPRWYTCIRYTLDKSKLSRLAGLHINARSCVELYAFSIQMWSMKVGRWR